MANEPWNKFTPEDPAELAQRFRDGETAVAIAASIGVTQIVVFRVLKEVCGDSYEQVVEEHWKNIGAARVKARAGSKTKGGARWFTAEQEDEVVKWYLDHQVTAAEVATKFGCSVIVAKRLLQRSLPADTRKEVQLDRRNGRRRVEYVSLTCICGKTFDMPPWKARTSKSFCSKACGYRNRQGQKSHLFGKTNHAVGRWYEVNAKKVCARSSWEFGVMLHFDRNEIDWKYEPQTFPITVNGKPTTYTPDFLLPDRQLYIEVKGYWRPLHRAKYDAFQATYPDLKIEAWEKPKLLEMGIITSKGVLMQVQ